MKDCYYEMYNIQSWQADIEVLNEKEEKEENTTVTFTITKPQCEVLF